MYLESPRKSLVSRNPHETWLRGKGTKKGGENKQLKLKTLNMFCKMQSSVCLLIKVCNSISLETMKETRVGEAFFETKLSCHTGGSIKGGWLVPANMWTPQTQFWVWCDTTEDQHLKVEDCQGVGPFYKLENLMVSCSLRLHNERPTCRKLRLFSTAESGNKVGISTFPLTQP